jgi:hypothetical protein
MKWYHILVLELLNCQKEKKTGFEKFVNKLPLIILDGIASVIVIEIIK